MTSDNFSVQIQVEEIKNEIKKFSKIVCSPNMKHVAALDEDSNISFWSIESKDQFPEKVKTIHIDNICTKSKGDRLFAISDNMFTSIGLEIKNHYNFKIFDFKTEDEVLLTFPDQQNEIDFLSFTDNGNIIMVNTKHYRAYVFLSKYNKWICKSMVELKYFKQIFITLKSKLIIFNDTIYEITVWDIETLSVKTHILIEWNYTLESIEISDDEELLLICAKSEETEETRLYVFSTETGINLAFSINRFHLIASRKGERLFYVLDDPPDKEYYIMDPYNLINPIDVIKLFENNQIQEPYQIKSDKIIYTIDGKLSIKELVPDNSEDWVKYLRRELKDTNSIITPSENTIKSINNILNKEYNEFILDNEKEFLGNYLKWVLELNDRSIKLTVIEFDFHKNDWGPNSSNLEIFPSYIFSSFVNEKNFILHCEVLENDDFIMNTYIGVIIWTFKSSKFTKEKNIKMHYYWNDYNKSITESADEYAFNKKINDDNNDDCFELWTSKRILPPSSYDTIYHNLNLKFGRKLLFLEFLEDNIKEEFYLTCYGKILMKIFISLNDDKWIIDLGNRLIDMCLYENNHLIFKLSLLSIIFENIYELSEKQPAFIASILSKIAFVVPSTNKNRLKSIPHLSSFGRYNQLSVITSLDILISKYWIGFQYWFYWFLNWFKNWTQWFQNLFQNYPIFTYLVWLLILLLAASNVLFIPILFLFVSGFYYIVNCCLYSIDENPTLVLAFPIPNFVSYSKDFYHPLKAFLLPTPSCFIYSNKLEKINYEFYKYLNGKALIEFKWNTYGKIYYLANWAIYTAFLGSFITFSSLSNDITWNHQNFFLITTFIFGFWLLSNEIRQFMYNPLRYFSSIWNYLDITALISTLATSYYWLNNGSVPTWAITFSTLFLELKFILFFRDLTPISSWISNENIEIMLLMIVVSFFTLIYLMNLFIGIISNLISDDENRNISYLILIAEILDEIELSYMLPHQRRKENWFPYTFFYGCHTYELREHIINIQNNKSTGFMPYLSNNLKEALKPFEEQTDYKQIKNIITTHAETIDEIKKSYDKAFKNLEELINNISNKLDSNNLTNI
ncbi:1779_t:CDS:2 [Scutellospora calospora]|uniref:1779_t:CDS:1 n=1 Tax=Scutellospora calospora TaxID=85575 RepID=A0ACA9K692_9GLOM|nr:1779_t:CDS:2 [Scutellospora calospora]